MPKKPKLALKLNPVSNDPDVKKKLHILVEQLSPEASTAALDAEINMLAETMDEVLRENGCIEPTDRAGEPLPPTATRVADVAHGGVVNSKARKLN